MVMKVTSEGKRTSCFVVMDKDGDDDDGDLLRKKDDLFVCGDGQKW